MPDALRCLLGSAIDYAGLFPPASVSMGEAVANHASYMASEHGWALGRFVVPAARLDELEQAAKGVWKPASRWRISALVDSPADLARCLAFNRQRAEVAAIDMVELKAADAEAVRKVMNGIPTSITAYVEIPLSAAAQLAPILVSTHARAKFRTGGITAAGFPTCAELAAAMAICSQNRLPFKATAGLHHPLRGIAPFTYQRDSAKGTMHGFLNVFIAAAFLWEGYAMERAVAILEETSLNGFHFTSEAVEWRGNRLDGVALTRCRREFAQSFGSCSFSEPIAELTSMALLHAGSHS